jgi:hypothetical protein
MVNGAVLGGLMAVGVLVAGCGSRVDGAGRGPPDAGGAGALEDSGGAGKAGAKAPSAPGERDEPALPTGMRLVAEIERIAGARFNVSDAEPSSLHCDGYYWDSIAPFVEATLSFRKDDFALQDFQFFLRVRRADGATTLRFQARVELDERLGSQGMVVDLRALDAGSHADFERHDLMAWGAAPEPLTGVSGSQIEEISLPLPAGSSDVLVAISPRGRVWLDSMRAE